MKREIPILEGKTYLAKIIKDPWRGYPGHKSIIGKTVKATSYHVVNVEWPNGAENSFSRDSIKVIKEL